MNMPRISSFCLAFLAGTGMCALVLAQELPTGASVAAGDVNISAPVPGTMTVQQGTPSAIINWQSFSVGEGGVLNFVQPDGQAAILNRVTGDVTTSIAGHISANGQVYIVNPNGVAITSGGTVSVGGFIGSTLGISDEDFLAGNATFAGDGSSQAVSNAGTITVVPGGYAALIGGQVNNSGTIIAPLGRIGLGAAERVTLDFSSDGFLQVALPSSDSGEGALISNTGTISANGGLVQISAAAAQNAARQVINLGGLVEARTVGGVSGNIILGGGGGQVAVTGSVDVSAVPPLVPPVPQPRPAALGGNVTITGAAISLAGADIDASGYDGGGSIRVGGDFHGGDILPRAGMLSVDDLTQISADATGNGNGGTVVLWSDDLTEFSGTISARGAGAGTGGDAEVSGQRLLAYNGTTDLRSESGIYGTLLLDPYNIYIVDDSQNNSDAPDFTPTGNDSRINVATLVDQLELSNVTVSTGLADSAGAQAGNIFVQAGILWQTGPTVLTLEAANDIYVDANIVSLSGGANLVAGRDVIFGANVPGVIELDVASSFFATAGRSIGFGQPASTNIRAGDSVGLAAETSILFSGQIVAEGNEVYLDAPTLQLDGTVSAANRVGILSNATTIGADVDTSLFEAFAPGGTFTLQPGAVLTANEAFIEAGTFINNSGPGAIEADRFLIYTTNWTDGNRNGLAAGNRYGVTYGDLPPGSVTEPGSFFFYADRPTLTVTVPSGTRGFGQSPLIGLATVTGLIDGPTGDTVETALGFVPTYGESIDPQSAPGLYLEALRVNAFTSPIGYQVVFDFGDLTIAETTSPPGTGGSPLVMPEMNYPQFAEGGIDNLSGVLGQQISEAEASLSLQALTARTEAFKAAIAACEREMERTDDTEDYIDCLSDALETYGDAIDDPLIQLPPELQGTVSVIRQTVQRMRTAASNPDPVAAVAEARQAVGDLVDYVRSQTDLIRAAEPETEALLVQHGTVIAGGLEALDLALVGAVEI